MVTRRAPWPAASVVAVVLAVAVVAAVIGPFPVTNGVARMAGWVVLVAGASVLVGRTGTVDLSTAATAAFGAYVGAVAIPLAGAPALLGLVAGTAAGAVAGTASGALAGRVGGRLAALPTLSVGLAVVAVLRSWTAGGGAAGYHAAPFLAAGDVTDAVAVTVMAGVALAVVSWWWSTAAAARASVGARAPGALAALGHHPAAATALAGALGGALLGAGGAAQAMVSGSVSPSAFGLVLAAALALAAVLGGAPPLGPLVGAAWLWGPAVVLPLAPVVGDAPPLLTTGVLGLALLAVRRGRPLLSLPAPTSEPVGSAPAPPERPGGAPDASLRTGYDTPLRTGYDTPLRTGYDRSPVLTVAPDGQHDGFAVSPGEVVAVVGPNGAGKSTLLARVGGQLPGTGAVALGGRPAPRGPVARARAGMARGWQRPPDVPPADLVAAADGDPSGLALAGAVAALLPGGVTSDPATAQLIAAIATGPHVLLLDEPASSLPEDVVVALVTHLAAVGIAVVLVDHRPAVLAVADRQVEVRPVVAAGG